MIKKLGLLISIIISLASCNSKAPNNDAPDNKKDTSEMYGVPANPQGTDTTARPAQLKYPDEKHFKNVKQLTFGGNNAEAYWSFDNSMFCFQSDYTAWGVGCDQIFLHKIADGEAMKMKRPKLISTGQGRTTCSYFMPGNKSILFASTHEFDKNCPAVPERRKDKKYLWSIYPSFDIYVSDLTGKIIKRLTNEKGYDAEATVSPKGDKIVFTSTRSGDLELWTMNTDGTALKQITSQLGYDGGAFFSQDGSKLIFRASRPKTKVDVKEYTDFYKQGLVSPTAMEIFMCNADGSNLKQITKLGNANWAPYLTPDGKKVIFSSNHVSGGYGFNLYMIGVDGTGLERVSYDDTFDAFPMFSFDGKYILFSSNRNNGGSRDTNLFLAEWQ